MFTLAVGKMACQQRNILPPFAQGRQMNSDQVDAVEQVFAESMFTDHLRKICIGGTYDADIHFSRTAVPQHFEGLVLQNAQQFYLATEIQLSDLIQEDRSPVGHFKPADAVCNSIRKGSFPVTEHFTFKQAL